MTPRLLRFRLVNVFIDLLVRQGERTGRRCRLRLRVDAAQRILVSGRVVEIGRGALDAG